MIGDEIGIGKQIITDVAVSAINKKVINLFWERYIGSTVGGVVGVGTGLVASPVVSGAAEGASATLTEKILENIFGRKSYSDIKMAKARTTQSSE